MAVQGDRWTMDQVLALAPDAASRTAGGRLATSRAWSGTGAGAQGVWGLCAGSGSRPYQTVVDLLGPGYRCSCPSRKFPCKHALGLLLLWAGGEGVPGGGEPPEWAAEWLTARQERAARTARTDPQGPAVAGAGERGGGTATADPEAARRRARRRAERIAAGASELERRLADLLREGLAGAERQGYAGWDETAARMVDAQAPGLEARVRELAAVPASGPGWPARMLEECALLHLLTRAYLGVEGLPEGLAATARSRVGITASAPELLASEPAVRDRWLVLGGQDSGDGRLTTRRVWLRGERSGLMALLLSYGAAGQSPPLALPTGLLLDADLVYHPAARPLRATLGTRHADPAEPAPDSPSPASPAGPDVAAPPPTAGSARPPGLAGLAGLAGGPPPAPATETPVPVPAAAPDSAPNSGPEPSPVSGRVSGPEPGPPPGPLGASAPSAAAGSSALTAAVRPAPPPVGAANGAAAKGAARHGAAANGAGSASRAPRVPPGVDVATALAVYGDALRDDPWLDAWPVVLSDVTPIPHADGWQLADARAGVALPVDPRCLGRTSLWQLAAVSGGAPVTVFGECGHRGFSPLTVWDPAPVPLQGAPGPGPTPYGGTS